MSIPKSYYVYEFSYPEEMPELAGIVFYVGKGTKSSRMDAHFVEAANGCDSEKCKAIRSIWDAGLVVVRRIVFETRSEDEALAEEKRRILLHQLSYLTNVKIPVLPEVSVKVRVERKDVVLANKLRDEIHQGRYEHGSRLPSTKKIMEHFDVSSTTVLLARARLVGEYLIVQRGGYYYVC